MYHPRRGEAAAEWADGVVLLEAFYDTQRLWS